MARDSEKAATISSQYPNVRVVKGSNDDHAVIRDEAKAADIVFRMASHID